jgi:tetrahydromethanopterin S-methyltransferase subunit G
MRMNIFSQTKSANIIGHMSDDQFTQLFKQITNIDARLDNMATNMATKDDINEIYNRLDDIAARLNDDDTERVALNSQVDRHEGWIKQLADKTNTDLAVEA